MTMVLRIPEPDALNRIKPEVTVVKSRVQPVQEDMEYGEPNVSIELTVSNWPAALLPKVTAPLTVVAPVILAPADVMVPPTYLRKTDCRMKKVKIL